VTPIAKEKFSSMEGFKGATEDGAAAWSEDLPERITLPPVLCPPWSLSHCEHVHELASDGAEVAIPCQCAMRRLTVESKPQEAPSTPAGECLLQATPSSVSPHPLSAPPSSPVPMMGLPMLLQPWEAMQDGNAAATPLPPMAETHEEASTANQNATLAINCESKDELASSVSVEAGRLSPIQASSMDSHGQQHVQDVEAPSQNGLKPPPLTQGQAPSQAPAKAHPPPPPGNIMAVMRAKRSASKLKRSTQMGSLYRHLRDRVEGSGVTHGSKRRQGKKTKVPAGTKGDAGQGMADALAEMTKRYCEQNLR
jgi:hypothetical protein